MIPAQFKKLLVALEHLTANTIHEQIELKYVALQLVHDKLIPTYQELGFEALGVGRQKFWMGMPLQSLCRNHT
jgi:hypothetical protein